MNKKLRIALYLRVSTEDQAKEGYSLEVQREYLEYRERFQTVPYIMREAMNHSFHSDTWQGFEVFKVYSDDGISGYSIRRPALQELLKDAKDKEAI